MSELCQTTSAASYSVEPVSEHLFLITLWTARAAPVFEDLLAGRLLVDVLRQQQHRADTWAFLIMPDYLSWFVQIKPGMSRHKLLEAVLGRSTVVINGYLERGAQPLWHSRYHCQRLHSEQEARRQARLTLSLPSRAGLVEGIGAYPLWDAPRWF